MDNGNVERILLGDGWVRIINCNGSPDYSTIAGKFVYHDDPIRLSGIASDLSCLVLEGLVPEIKYKQRLNEPDSPFAGRQPPIVFYASQLNKEHLYQRLLGYGLGQVYWVADAAIVQR
jgi:hypothetical protein